jgi:hypothetical protein
MNDSLINIIDSLKLLTINPVKDTVYIVGLNSSKSFIDILPILIAAVALILSSVATFISKRALESNIKHQKLSVIPIITSYEDFTLRPNCEGVGLLLKNCGLGPALIKEFKLNWGKIEIKGQKDYPKIPLQDLFGAFEGGYFSKNSAFDKNSEKWIMRIPLNNLYLPNGAIDMDKVEKIEYEIKNNLRLEILYRSIYNEEEYEYIFKYPFIKT